jgi:hypothetical protein
MPEEDGSPGPRGSRVASAPESPERPGSRTHQRVGHAIVGAALLAACSPPTSPTEHLRLEALVDRAEVSATAPVLIRVRLSNAPVTGARTAVLHGSGSCTLGYRVRDAGGSVVAPAQRSCTPDVRRLRLEPGHGIEEAYPWSGTAGDGGAEPLAPGTYSLVGVLETREVRLESAPVLIRVLGTP